MCMTNLTVVERWHTQAIHRHMLCVHNAERYHRFVSFLHPFRGLRYAHNRVVMTRVLADDNDAMADARHARHMLGPSGALMSAEWQRSGVLLVDPQPTLTVVRVGEGTFEIAAAIDAAAAPLAEHARAPTAAATPTPEERQRCQGAPIELGYEDEGGRVQRMLRNETERDADTHFELAGNHVQAWSIDDETTIARVLTAVERSNLSLLSVPTSVQGSVFFSTTLLCRLCVQPGSDHTQEALVPWPVGLVWHRPRWSVAS
jgi:hypothetical protein